MEDERISLPAVICLNYDSQDWRMKGCFCYSFRPCWVFPVNVGVITSNFHCPCRVSLYVLSFMDEMPTRALRIAETDHHK
jgi:hypothetical protein